MENGILTERQPMPHRRYTLRGWLPYLAAGVFAGVLLLWYSFAYETAALPFTWPVAKLAGLYIGVPFIFDRETGFVSQALSVAIGKSCSGVNFFALFFCMSIFAFLGYMNGWRKKAFFALIMLAASYAVTVLVNTARIIAAISLRSLPVAQMPGMHTAIGVAFYSTALLTGYLILRRITRKGGPT